MHKLSTMTSNLQKNSKTGPKTHEYKKFSCRVCGGEVFVPLLSDSSLSEQRSERGLLELTCSRGHTDAYETSQIDALLTAPLKSLKVRRAMAGIG